MHEGKGCTDDEFHNDTHLNFWHDKVTNIVTIFLAIESLQIKKSSELKEENSKMVWLINIFFKKRQTVSLRNSNFLLNQLLHWNNILRGELTGSKAVTKVFWSKVVKTLCIRWKKIYYFLCATNYQMKREPVCVASHL